jgi:hypothetical protein
MPTLTAASTPTNLLSGAGDVVPPPPSPCIDGNVAGDATDNDDDFVLVADARVEDERDKRDSPRPPPTTPIESAPSFDHEAAKKHCKWAPGGDCASDEDEDEDDSDENKATGDDDVAADDGPPSIKKADLIIACDVTGSMGSYIVAAKNAIELLITEVSQTPNIDLRVGGVAYRDFGDKDVIQTTPLTADTSVASAFFRGQTATGGGDIPECFSLALHTAGGMDFREEDDVTKIVVIIVEAPPHGIKERYVRDNWPDGHDQEMDPMMTAREFAQRGIRVYPIACQPSISNLPKTAGFYAGIASQTGGRAINLDRSIDLGQIISGVVQEEVMMDALARKMAFSNVKEETGSEDSSSNDSDVGSKRGLDEESEGARQRRVNFEADVQEMLQKIGAQMPILECSELHHPTEEVFGRSCYRSLGEATIQADAVVNTTVPTVVFTTAPTPSYGMGHRSKIHHDDHDGLGFCFPVYRSMPSLLVEPVPDDDELPVYRSLGGPGDDLGDATSMFRSAASVIPTSKYARVQPDASKVSPCVTTSKTVTSAHMETIRARCAALLVRQKNST